MIVSLIMSRCEFDEQLGPYVDGELDAARAAALEGHLPACPPCARELAELRGLKRLFGAAASGAGAFSFPGAVRRRLHEHVDSLSDMGLLRIGRALSGIAACVLVAGSLWLTSASRRPVERPIAAWEASALLMPVAAGPSSADDLASPEWVLRDLSGQQDADDED
jgi:anti-sigma factor RsiW